MKFIDRDPHLYTHRVKEAAVRIRLHPNNINRDSGIEIPEAWMPTIKIHNKRKTVQQRTAEGTAIRRSNETMGESECTNHSRSSWYKWLRVTSRPHRLKKTSSMQSKRRDLPRESNDNNNSIRKFYWAVVTNHKGIMLDGTKVVW